MMKATQIRELTAQEISTRIAELERERFNLRFRGATQTLDDPLRLRVIRRDIARLKTVLREQEMAGSTQAGAAGKGR
jgi:large subunit ribosomal protein L29